MKYITALDLKNKLESDQVTLLDIREPYECEIVSIGGLSIPMAEIGSRISELSADKPIVVMCRTGKRAEAVANLLESDFDFESIYVLEGGIEAWIITVDPSLELY